MEPKSFRRILDSIAKKMEQDSIAIEVFVSDNGDPLLFTILMKLPQRRIMEARVETLPKNISGVPEYFSQDLSALKDIEINEGFLKNSREALQDKLTLKLLFDAFIENARICCRPYQKISLLEEVPIGRDFRKKGYRRGRRGKRLCSFRRFYYGYGSLPQTGL